MLTWKVLEITAFHKLNMKAIDSLKHTDTFVYKLTFTSWESVLHEKK